MSISSGRHDIKAVVFLVWAESLLRGVVYELVWSFLGVSIIYIYRILSFKFTERIPVVFKWHMLETGGG